MANNTGGKVYIVEHLDPELGPWSELEYLAIARESQETGSSFTLSSLPEGFKVPEGLTAIPIFKATKSGVEDIYASNKSTVCLLDPSAEKDLAPEDAQEFGTFLFGGILGESGKGYDGPTLPTFLEADQDLQAMILPEVTKHFKLRSGCSLMNQDRTSELRKKGFTGRRLGPVQMTTDTAVRVTRMVIQQQSECNVPESMGVSKAEPLPSTIEGRTIRGLPRAEVQRA